MRENVAQNNSEYGHFLRGGILKYPKKHASLKTKLLRFNSIAFLIEELWKEIIKMSKLKNAFSRDINQ